MNAIKRMNWFWPWNDEKQESWLREMSNKGYHLQVIKSVDNYSETPFPYPKNGHPGIGWLSILMSPSKYIFEQEKPADYIYRLDYFTGAKDFENYLQIFQDSGWSYLGKIRGWQYFRQKADGINQQEIYTDNSSKIKKYHRNMIFLIILLPVLISSVLVFLGTMNAKAGISLSGALILVTLYSVIRLWLRMNQLKKGV